MVSTKQHSIIKQYNDFFYDFDIKNLPKQLESLISSNCEIFLSYPFGKLIGLSAFIEQLYQPLSQAIPDLERRVYLCMEGNTEEEEYWVGSAGYYTGVFEAPWLDIPPTQHIVTMRFHEFFRIKNNQIIEIRGLWDIPELMLQADAWPMSKSLGVELLVPGPATQDGIIREDGNSELTQQNLQLVKKMLEALGKFSSGGVEAMNLDTFWHPKMNWYGPSGIGSNRRISGFRLWHQYPFLSGMPDRWTVWDNKSTDAKLRIFAEGNYVALFGWPALNATVSHDGWLGLAPTGKQISIKSLDFWRCEKEMIRENWVLIDVLDVYHQLSIDVLERMKEMTFARQTAQVKAELLLKRNVIKL